MRAIICGAGLQGVPIAHALLKLGLDVHIVEPFKDNVDKCRAKLKETNPRESNNHKYLVYNSLKDVPAAEGLDFVISAAPYHQNVKIAKWAFDNGLMYFDLGGDPNTRAEIHDAAISSGCSTMTDLGLAPGLVNMVAEYMTHSYIHGSDKVTDVFMRVGGLPIDPVGFLNYKRTWSTHGLRNEYSGACLCVKYGEQTSEEALTEVERIEAFPELGVLECFHTKGGLSHSYETMYEDGIINCNYKTIRWPGHADTLRFLIEQCKLDNDALDKAIENSCPITREDQVLLMAQVNDQLFKTIIPHSENWTAMQIATAFPAAATAFTVATLFGSEEGKNFTYKDIASLQHESMDISVYHKFVDTLCEIDSKRFGDFNAQLYADDLG